MVLRQIVLLVSVLAACGSAPKAGPDHAAPPPPPPAPVASSAPALDPPQPILRLPRNFLPTGYRARLALDPARDGFTGSIEIAGEVRERSKGIWLHGRGLKVASAKLTRGTQVMPVEIVVVGEDLLALHLAEPVDPGPVTIAIDYSGAFDLVGGNGAYRHTTDGVPYILTQFESISARRVFPCFDEPDNKVAWQLTLDVPKDLFAVTNTMVTGETALDATTKRLVFAPTRPLPSYLIAFGVGPYEPVDAGKTRAGTQIRVIALKGRAREATWAAETSAKIVQLLEDYFGSPYPYDKLDQISRPTAGGGAMENAGLITYGSTLILRDPDHITPGERYAWVDVAAHELAHQWFGDLVTTAWWDDIWLNEGFADWVGAKIVGQFEPSWHPDLLGTAQRASALRADSVVSARRVRQPITNIGDIYQAFDSITYEKGASLLAMFERAVGPEKFRDGVRAYLAKHRFGNATSADFIAAISQVAGRDVAPAFGSFLDQAGTPVVRSELRCEAGQPPVLSLAQHRYVRPGSPPVAETTPWRIPVCVAYDRGGSRAETCTELTSARSELALDSKTCPAWVFANAGGLGYYRISQPETALVALRDRGWSQLTPAERLIFYGDVSAFVSTGELDVGLELSLVPRMLAERNRVAIGLAVETAYRAQGLLVGEPQTRLNAWIRQVFGPTARTLGWQPRRGDDIDTQRARGAMVPLVAWSGDASLRAAAVALAKGWRTLPQTNRSALLSVAADTDAATFNRLVSALPTENDVELRRDLLNAVSDVTNEGRLRAVLALALDPKYDINELFGVIFSGHNLAQYRIVDLYFREHFAELFERIPDKTSATWLSLLFLRGCDASQRDDGLAFAREHLGQLPGADTAIARNLERNDQCIAARKLLAPKLATWLARPAR